MLLPMTSPHNAYLMLSIILTDVSLPHFVMLLTTLPPPTHPLGHRTGELTNRLASDTQVIQDAVTTNISMLARYSLQMVLSIGLMFYISPRLTAVLLSVVPVIVVSAVQYGETYM